VKINELIECLNTYTNSNGNIRVGFVGYFGEFYPLDKYSLSTRPINIEGVSEKQIKEEVIVEIQPAWIGGEPD